MLVKDLINQLQAFDGDKIVRVSIVFDEEDDDIAVLDIFNDEFAVLDTSSKAVDTNEITIQCSNYCVLNKVRLAIDR
jgi:hypothetical protein